MEAKKRPGPVPSRLGQSELDAILTNMAEGHGRMRSCQLAGIPYRTFGRRLAEDAEVRDLVLTVEGARADECVKVLFDLRNHPEPAVCINAIKAYLHRHDRQKEARRAIRERREAAGVGHGEKLSAIMPRVSDVLWKYCPMESRKAMIEELDRVVEELAAAGG